MALAQSHSPENAAGGGANSALASSLVGQLQSAGIRGPADLARVLGSDPAVRKGMQQAASARAAVVAAQQSFRNERNRATFEETASRPGLFASLRPFIPAVNAPIVNPELMQSLRMGRYSVPLRA